MDNLAPLIADLALILICAGIMTLVFKKLKQPLVLGYIVAGFIASPHFTQAPENNFLTFCSPPTRHKINYSHKHTGRHLNIS